MTTSKESVAATLNIENRDKNVIYYIPDFDLPALNPIAQDLLTRYSKVPADQVRSHVLELRDRAWHNRPYPCIGQMRFLDFGLRGNRSYRSLVTRLNDPLKPMVLLDVGCCLGQDLRKLCVDGALSARLYGIELEQEFIDLGFELFRDRDTWEGRFVAGDVLDDGAYGPGGILQDFVGCADVVHVASFLHLFSWKKQVDAAVRLTHFLKDETGVMIMGRQLRSEETTEQRYEAMATAERFVHNLETHQEFWKEVGRRTGTEWKVEAESRTVGTNSVDQDKPQWRDGRIPLLFFEVTRTA